jgi:hypothetical protein
MICARCMHEIAGTHQCRAGAEIVFPDGTRLPAVLHSGSDYCADCGVMAGSVHHRYCDQEPCPRCGAQLLSCNCCVDQSLTLSRKSLIRIGGLRRNRPIAQIAWGGSEKLSLPFRSFFFGAFRRQTTLRGWNCWVLSRARSLATCAHRESVSRRRASQSALHPPLVNFATLHTEAPYACADRIETAPKAPTPSMTYARSE